MSLKGKRILYVGGHNKRTEFMVELSRMLEEKFNTQSFFMSGAVGDDEIFADHNITSNFIQTTPFFLKQGPYNIDYLKNLEVEYGVDIWTVWQISAPRNKKRMEAKEEEILPWIEQVSRDYEKVFQTFQPDYMVVLGVCASAGMEIAFHIANGHDCEVLQLTNARIKGKITLDNSLIDRWPLLVQRYKQYKKHGLTDEQKKDARNFIDNFKANRPKPSLPTDSRNDSLARKMQLWKNYPKMIYRRKLWKGLDALRVAEIMVGPIKDKILTHSSLFEDPVPGEKYVYFPLHYQPEASTSSRGKWVVEQPTLIQNISKAMPCGYKLYIKEHTHGASGRPEGFYKTIKNLPNVRLIRPTASSFEITQKASLIATITGTVGWEGIIFQKPVISFGSAFFNEFEDVIKIHDFNLLPAAIRNNLDKVTPFEKVLPFVKAVMDASFEGLAICPGDCNDKSLASENLKKIVGIFEEYIKATNSPASPKPHVVGPAIS